MKITPILETLELKKIPDKEYFSNKYRNYISNSRLGLINPLKDGSEEKFFNGFNPIYSDSIILGSMVHEISLQEEFFEIVDCVDRPTAKLGYVADELYPTFLERDITDEDITKAITKIDYYKGILTDKIRDTVNSKCIPYLASRRDFESTYTGDKELIYSDPKLREKAWNCITALKNNKNIQNLLHPQGLINESISECEMGIILDIKVEMENSDPFILHLKSKLDHFSIDRDLNTICVNDIKTLGRILSEFNLNIQNYSYNRELAMYSWLLSLCAKKFYRLDNPTITGNYLVVSTIPQYYTKVVPVTKKMYKEGWNEFKYLLELVCKAVSTNHREFAEWV